jgi:hypothetical protein
MSDFHIDDIGKLNDFASMIARLMEHWFGVDPASQGSAPGGAGQSSSGPSGSGSGAAGQLLDDALMPSPGKFLPNMGQLTAKGDISQFSDAIDLYGSYDDARRALVGDPGEFMTSPTSSSLAAFCDGLSHLYGTAIAIYQNYDAASNDDKLSADQIAALLNAPPAQQTPPVG